MDIKIGFMKLPSTRCTFATRISRDISSFEPCRSLGCHPEFAFERQPDSPDCTLVEKTPDQGNAVWYAARRIESRHRIRGIRRPIAARLGDFYESRAKGQRRMPRGIRDDQYFVAQ